MIITKESLEKRLSMMKSEIEQNDSIFMIKPDVNIILEYGDAYELHDFLTVAYASMENYAMSIEKTIAQLTSYLSTGA